MADRTAAGIFARVFNHLAENPTKEAQRFARSLWDDTGEFDFSPHQMYADEALAKLGMLRISEGDGEEEGSFVYWDEDGFDDARTPAPGEVRP